MRPHLTRSYYVAVALVLVIFLMPTFGDVDGNPLTLGDRHYPCDPGDVTLHQLPTHIVTTAARRQQTFLLAGVVVAVLVMWTQQDAQDPRPRDGVQAVVVLDRGPPSPSA